jgi:LAGLIDADG endonuclease
MFFTHQRLNVKHATKKTHFRVALLRCFATQETNQRLVFKQEFYLIPEPNFSNWLNGVTDGDGSFSFSVNKKKNSVWNCTFKIAQKTYNLRLLYYIKKNLGYGSINTKSGKNINEFRIRDRKTLLNLVVPLFTQYPLYSTKQFYFSRWVKALHILENTKYTTSEKNTLLTLLKNELPSDTYISPAWEKSFPSNEWIYGFIEAEKSFFIVNKDKNIDRMVHSFGITQKLDKIILDFLQKKFHISSKVLHTKRNIYKLETTNSRSIVKIQKFFLNKLKGIKSLEYKIWARSLHYKKNNEKLLIIQNQLQKLKNKLKK